MCKYPPGNKTLAMGSSQFIDDVPSYKPPFSSGISQLATLLRLTPEGIVKILELMIFLQRSQPSARQDIKRSTVGVEWHVEAGEELENRELRSIASIRKPQNDDKKCETAM